MNTNIIKKPRITEKASNLYEQNVYTFDVVANATKNEVMKAIFQLYKVKPLKVRMITMKPKKVLSRAMRGTRGGGKKALVYLKANDKISIL